MNENAVHVLIAFFFFLNNNNNTDSNTGNSNVKISRFVHLREAASLTGSSSEHVDLILSPESVLFFPPLSF